MLETDLQVPYTCCLDARMGRVVKQVRVMNLVTALFLTMIGILPWG